MEWSKVEQKWKEKLDERTIAPSPNAWNKLAGQSAEDKKKAKRRVYQKWIGMAACLILGGILGLVFLKTEKTIELPSIDLPIEQHYVGTDQEESIEELREAPVVNLIKQTEERPASLVEQYSVTQKIIPVELEYKDIEVWVEMKDQNEIVDSLILKERLVKKAPSKVIVNSHNLLQQIEGEIEIEYRETKLEKIVGTAKKVVTDISNSKYEK